jgi:hypothetical protein
MAGAQAIGRKLMKNREVSEHLIKATKALLNAIQEKGDGKEKKVKKSVIAARLLLRHLPGTFGGGEIGEGGI